MRHLTFTKLSSILLYAAISSMAMLSSCDDDEAAEVADFASLNAKITEAETLITSTAEGTAEGQYPRGSQATLQAAIDAAQAVADDETSEATAVSNTVIALQAAMDLYTGSVLEAIDPDNLVGHWIFDEGTGTTVTDYSGNSFDGTFQTGHTAFGAGTPSWGTDRYGNENSAIVFDDGAWVEVPYNAALNPTAITVSVWVNVAVVSANNRFLGLHSWNGYKFQLQDANYPFFTAATTDGIWDNDAASAVVENEWWHIAVTYGGGEMVFYIEGEEVNRVTRESDMLPVTGHNIAIGVGSSKYADVDTNYDADQIIPAAWGGYFQGSIDELRIYKAVLSPTQVKSIFDLEKP